MTTDTPIGTTTVILNADNVVGNVADNVAEGINSISSISSISSIALSNKQIIYDTVDYYNVIANRHMNVFANGILTSCRYNNLYPVDSSTLCWIKGHGEHAEPPEREKELRQIFGKYYDGLRIGEQTTISIDKSISYVERMKRLAF